METLYSMQFYISTHSIFSTKTKIFQGGFTLKNKETKNQRLIDSYDYLTNSASSQDCTGLIPFAPTCEEELESYESVYSYLPPEIPSGKNTADEP